MLSIVVVVHAAASGLVDAGRLSVGTCLSTTPSHCWSAQPQAPRSGHGDAPFSDADVPARLSYNVSLCSCHLPPVEVDAVAHG
jgi:hypothetical protein